MAMHWLPENGSGSVQAHVTRAGYCESHQPLVPTTRDALKKWHLLDAPRSQSLLHRPPLENVSTVCWPSFFIQAFMGNPPNVTCNPSIFSPSSISPRKGWLPKGSCTDFTEDPETFNSTGAWTPGIFHLPGMALLPSAAVMEPAGMRLPNFSPSLETVVRRTSPSSPIAAEDSALLTLGLGLCS